MVAEDPSRARLIVRGREYRCSVGAGGAVARKSEGDGATPVGLWPVRRLFWRADKGPAPVSDLPAVPVTPDLGWCDDPSDHENYNRLVTLPCSSNHEELWREDELYDLVVELGYNDRPVVPGRGSAIFLHVARQDFAPTAGCVALAREDLVAVVRQLRRGDAVRITRIYP